MTKSSNESDGIIIKDTVSDPNDEVYTVPDSAAADEEQQQQLMKITASAQQQKQTSQSSNCSQAEVEAYAAKQKKFEAPAR